MGGYEQGHGEEELVKTDDLAVPFSEILVGRIKQVLVLGYVEKND